MRCVLIAERYPSITLLSQNLRKFTVHMEIRGFTGDGCTDCREII